MRLVFAKLLSLSCRFWLLIMARCRGTKLPFALLLASLFAVPAYAQPQPPPSILGDWEGSPRQRPNFYNRLSAGGTAQPQP
jgi:hypothetical protein